MDFTKLISLLDTKSLFFARADKLGDPFEGALPKADVDYRDIFLTLIKQGDMSKIRKIPSTLHNIYGGWRRLIAVNCWHMNEYESAAMWKLYLKSNEGVAIQSTYRLLKDSFIDEKQFFVGQVKYIDYEKDELKTGNFLESFMHKRKSFEHEQEIRALFSKPPGTNKDGYADFDIEVIHDGVPIKIDINKLIQCVYVSPLSSNWFFDLIKSVIQRYGYTFQVRRSQMDNSPLF